MPEPLPSKQSNRSRSSVNENSEPGFHSRKRKHSVTDKNDVVPKRLCEDSELLSDLQDEFRQDSPDGFHNSCQNDQYRNNIPDTLIKLMYQLDLSVLCTLRKSTHEHKYASTSLAFGDSEIDKFSDIVLRYEEKSIHLHIETVDKYYVDNNIGYTGLFSKGKEKRRFYINDYFDSFVKYLMSKLDSSLNNIEYLIIHTNTGLDLTEANKLKRGRSRNFYPFKFDNMNTKEHHILKDFFFIKDDARERGFYQFSRDKIIREELLKRLEFSAAMQKAIAKRSPCEGFETKIKEAFLDKLIFAVNQPNREKLNSLIRNKMKENSEVQHNYKTLQKKILCTLAVPGKHKKIKNFVSRIVYEFSLLMSFLHDMFLHKNMFSINFEGQSPDISNGIVISYRNRITYVKADNADSDIDYSKLFPSKQEEENTFSINKHFALFVEELKNDIRYFIIYTNANLMLTEEKILQSGKPEDFYHLKFDNIDIQKKRYKILRNCTCINGNGLYKFAQEETTRENVLNLLKLPPFLQKEKEEGCLSDENEKDIKVQFLDRLIFAVNQYDKNKLKSIIKNEVTKFGVPYNHEELREIALRWLESHEYGHITKGMMEKLLEDIKNNRSSYRKTQNRDINAAINFAKTVVGREGTPAFNLFLTFLIKGKGRKYLQVLKREGINQASMSSILSKAGANAVKTFKELYDLWFDTKGNKTQYLKTLEENGLSLANMSSILHGAAANAPRAFKELYDLWFDQNGKKTRYLIKLEESEVDFVRISSILSGVGANATKAFKELYDLWFDAEGNKTQYLEVLEKEGVNLSTVSSILGKAGANATKAFKELYELWFDAEGNKTQYLETLEKERVNLSNISSILNGAGANAAKAFKELYDLWFDADGNKTRYLKTLEEKGMGLANMSNILHRSKANAAKAFKELYDLWFDAKGNKTQYLKTLGKEGINLSNISSILGGAGANAAKTFKELYDLWLDAEGNKTQHLEHFVKKKDGEESFTLHNLSGMLGRAGANAKDAFEKLHDLCFNDKGERTELLDDFYKAGFKPSNLSCMLCGSGVHISSTLKKLHSVCFNEKRERTKLLDDLYKAGFRPCDLCSILSGTANSFKKFHDFCFIGKTKEYLCHFLNEKNGFTASNLARILHGAKVNICSALKNFHDVCFDETGNTTQLLDDFYKEGFRPIYLSNVLSMAGNNAAFILRNFHTLCFKENYLSHFLAEKKLFTPKNLSSKILYGVGINICPIFEKFHDLCFDKAGNKTEYLKNLITDKRHEVFSILYEKVRGVPFTSLDNISLQQQNISGIIGKSK